MRCTPADGQLRESAGAQGIAGLQLILVTLQIDVNYTIILKARKEKSDIAQSRTFNQLQIKQLAVNGTVRYCDICPRLERRCECYMST